ncbi:SDR family NAD(P)-dependent oxidoreductase [Sphingomonas sp. UYP23]
MPVKTAIVTGSTKGIGRALAYALLKRGVNVVISAPDGAEARRVAAAFPAGGAQAIGIACDVTSAAAVERLWEHAAAHFGGVDLWVNNAGLALTGQSIADLPVADLRQMLDINLVGTLHGCQTAIRGYRAQGRGGAIYNMLGAGADGEPVPRMAGYATSKAAVTFLTRSLAAELADSDILVGGLSPGLVITEGFLREHAGTPPETRAARDAVVNVIGDHPETIGRWGARIVDANTQHGRMFTWLTAKRIQRRKRRPRDILSRYRCYDTA